MNQKKWKQIIEILLFTILTCYVLVHLSYSLRDNLYKTVAIMKGYYAEEKDTLDVIFLGTSCTFSAFAPMELWESHGIAAYNFCTNSQFEDSMPYSIREITKYQHPKLLVIDISPYVLGANSNNRRDNEEYMRYNTDGWKYSKNRFDLVNALVPNRKDRLYYYFDILFYHTNEPNLSNWNWKKDNCRKGFASLNTITPFTEDQWIDELPDGFEMPADELEYLDNLLGELEKYDFDVLFVSQPFFHYEEKLENAKREQWCREYLTGRGYSYLSLNDYREEMGIDPATDYSIDYIHFHTASALKITDFIGRYLKENYTLENHKGDPAYSKWDSQYQEWEALRDADLAEIEGLRNGALMQQDTEPPKE